MWPLRRQLKPSEYADYMLHALVKAYDDPDDDRAREQGLSAPEMALKARAYDVKWIRLSRKRWRAVESGSMKAVADAVRHLLKRQHIYEAGVRDGLYKPTAEGFKYYREHLTPWYMRSLRAVGLGSVVRGIVVSVVATLVTMAIVAWVSGVSP